MSLSRTTLSLAALSLVALSSAALTLASDPAPDAAAPDAASGVAKVRYGTETIDGLDIFFREAGDPEAPQLVLLHGFPTSSHMFRDLIPDLAEDFRVIAPDYPGFGLSSAPPADEYDYTFDNLAGVVDALLERRGYDRYALYVMDYGAPVGYRIATAHPERVTGLVVQNGNAYVEGIGNDFWEPVKAYWKSGAPAEREALRPFLGIEGTKWQFLHGTREPDTISPDNWLVVQPLLDRPGNAEIQLDLFLDYGSNPPLYPSWQRYLREHQPPTLIVWGAKDEIFPAAGAHPYLRDLPEAELHLLDTGHFALEEEGDRIAAEIIDFFGPGKK